MTFQQKIDKVLATKGIKLWKLAQESGLGTTLEKAYAENREMRENTTGKFLQKMGISAEWWVTGKGEIFVTGSVVEEETPVYGVHSETKKPDSEETRLLKRSIDRIIDTNEYLLKRVRDLENQLGLS